MDWVVGIVIGSFGTGMVLLTIILLWETREETESKADELESRVLKEHFRAELEQGRSEPMQLVGGDRVKVIK